MLHTYSIFRWCWVFAFVLLGSVAHTQTLSFGTEVGVSIPTISLTDNSEPHNLTHVTPGFNMRLIGQRYFNNWFVGGMVGYAVYGMDQEAVKRFLNPPNADLLTIDVESYQNINIMARGGYKFTLKEESIFVNPFVGLGVGAFNSASYLVKYTDSNEPYQIYKKGGNVAALATNVGCNAQFAVNEIIFLGAYADYYLGDFTIDEQAGAIGTIDDNYPFPIENVTYQLRNFNVGASVTLIL